MDADLVVSNCQIVTPSNTYNGNIYKKNEKIIAITENKDMTAKEEVDAANNYVLPGMVDEHVHMMDPGFTDREDWEQGTKAAARGGITTVIDHHRSDPLVYTSSILEEKTDYITGKAVVDFGQLGGLDLENLDDLKPMWDSGALGFKGFMCELHGVPDISEGKLRNIMLEAVKFGATVMLHCESDSILKESKKIIDQDNRTDRMCISEWRNPESEFVATMDAINLAELTGCRVLVAHVSQPRLLKEIQSARLRGVNIYAESCPQYFYLDHTDLENLGPYVKFTPAIRSPETKNEMRVMLGKEMVDTIGTDHCPFPKESKDAGLSNIHDAPFGIPGIDTTVRLMLNAVNDGCLNLNQLTKMCCENPSRIFNLFPKKGAIQVGSDADLIIVDLDARETIKDEDIVSKCNWSPFNNLEVKGSVVRTIVRGKTVMKDGVVSAPNGWGKPVQRA